MALTKADSIQKIQSTNGLTQKQGTKLFETTINIIKNRLASGEDVLISAYCGDDLSCAIQ